MKDGGKSNSFLPISAEEMISTYQNQPKYGFEL